MANPTNPMETQNCLKQDRSVITANQYEMFDVNCVRSLEALGLIIDRYKFPAEKSYGKSFTVEPPLTDTSRRRTPLVSGHLVMFSATYKHYIFILP